MRLLKLLIIYFFLYIYIVGFLSSLFLCLILFCFYFVIHQLLLVDIKYAFLLV